MKPNISHPILSAVTSLVLALNVSAADWPQWRGQDRNDHSPDTGLLKEWPKGGPKQLWIFKDCGKGYSGPSIVGGRIFTMGARDDITQLICLDAKSGKEIWATDIAAVYPNRWGDGPRSTPTVDGGFVYAMGGKGDLICARVSNGEIVWRTHMTKKHGGKLQNWGYTESVLVDGDNVVCTPGGKRGALAAFNKKTGELVWQSRGLTDNAQYSSILPIDHGGKRQYVQLFMNTLAGVSAEDGKLLWKTEFSGRTAVIPTPIFEGGRVYVAAGYGVGCKQIALGGDNPEVTYENDAMVNHHGGVILLDGHVYGHSDKGGWTCQDFENGEVKWQSKELGKGAIGYADGRFYCVAESDGTVALIDASTEGWKERGRFKLDPQTEIRAKRGKIWTHPVILDGRLYLRDQDLFYCYDVRG